MSSDDVNCPYCNQSQDIEHEDGLGYEEDTVHEQPCISCSKIFAFTTSISIDYEVHKAPCLNGGEHKWTKHYIFPRHWPEAKRCDYCGEENKGYYVENIN